MVLMNKVTIRVRVALAGSAAPSGGFYGDVLVGGMVYATVTAATKSEARREAKRAAEEMGLVSL